MERTRQKLHSRRGASILLALVLTLVAAMVCAVILSAALTAAKRVRDDREAQQQMLSLTSAARYVKACMEDAKYENTKITPLEEITYYDEKTKDLIHTGEYQRIGPTVKGDPVLSPSPFSNLLAVFADIADEADNPNIISQGPYYIVVVPQNNTAMSPSILRFSLQIEGEGVDLDKIYNVPEFVDESAMYQVINAALFVVKDASDPTRIDPDRDGDNILAYANIKADSLLLKYGIVSEPHIYEEEEDKKNETWKFVNVDKLTFINPATAG